MKQDHEDMGPINTFLSFIIFCVLVNISSQGPHCVGGLINCCIVITSCRCVGSFFKYRRGAITMYPPDTLYISLVKVKKGLRYGVYDSFTAPDCHPSEFDKNVYGHDLGAVRLMDIIDLNGTKKIQPMKGPALQPDEEKYDETYHKVIGKTCKVHYMKRSFIPLTAVVDIKILKLEECMQRLCNDNDPTRLCKTFNSSFNMVGWGCGSVPKYKHTRLCYPHYGSPIICDGLSVGVASSLCRNETLLYSRIDVDMHFYIKMLELEGVTINVAGNKPPAYAAVIVNRSSRHNHCVGAVVTAFAILTSCRCVARYMYTRGSPLISKYAYTQFQAVMPIVSKAEKYEIAGSFYAIECGRSVYEPETYVGDIGCFLLSVKLNLGTIAVIKGPNVDSGKDELDAAFQGLKGGAKCQQLVMDVPFTHSASLVDVKIIKDDDCLTKKCASSNEKCDDFKDNLSTRGWACVESTKNCIPSYGSPIVCNQAVVGVVSRSCSEKLIIINRVDVFVDFFGLVLELDCGTSLYKLIDIVFVITICFLITKLL